MGIKNYDMSDKNDNNNNSTTDIDDAVRVGGD